MRCANCGFPLSPSRTSCPKCGTAVNNIKAPASPGKISLSGIPGTQAQPWTNNGGAFTPTMAPPPNNGGPAPLQNINAPVTAPPSAGEGQAAWPGFQPAPRPFAQQPRSFSDRTGKQSLQMRFTVAGLLVLLGGLLLFFVFLMAQGLHPQSAAQVNNPSGNAPQPTNAAATQAPTVSVSPTATVDGKQYPAQQYIFSAQTATANGSQPGTPSTTFKSGQKIYVTFSIHSTTPGAYCISWFLANKEVSNYQNPVSAGSSTGYSWAMISGTGPAYVEIYWASSKACTDKVLAQHVDFTME